MTSQATLTLFQSFIPILIGVSIALLALLGTIELVKETRLAFKKGANA